MVEIEKVMKNTVRKGEVKFGFKQTKKAINDKKAKIVVISNNCPFKDKITKISEKNKIPVFNSKSNSIDLGYACGKSFAVSTFAVIDDGGTNILNLQNNK